MTLYNLILKCMGTFPLLKTIFLSVTRGQFWIRLSLGMFHMLNWIGNQNLRLISLLTNNSKNNIQWYHQDSSRRIGATSLLCISERQFDHQLIPEFKSEIRRFYPLRALIGLKSIKITPIKLKYCKILSPHLMATWYTEKHSARMLMQAAYKARLYPRNHMIIYQRFKRMYRQDVAPSLHNKT
jgi:hypothetical protein